MASVVGGTILGTLIGAGAGGGRGALIGGAAGAVGCAVLAALDAQDRERVRNAQVAAAASNRPNHISYSGTDNRLRTVDVKPRPLLPAAETDGRLCRRVDTTAAVAGAGTAELPPQLVCRTPEGIWLQV